MEARRCTKYSIELILQDQDPTCWGGDPVLRTGFLGTPICCISFLSSSNESSGKKVEAMNGDSWVSSIVLGKSGERHL